MASDFDTLTLLFQMVSIFHSYLSVSRNHDPRGLWTFEAVPNLKANFLDASISIKAIYMRRSESVLRQAPDRICHKKAALVRC